MMDYRRAQALAEELIKTGQNKGLSREALVQQIVAESGGAGAPGTAIGTALMVPQPREVTPATPAPMQPGIPLVAPKPTAMAATPAPEQAAPQRPAPRPSQFRPMFETARARLGQMQAAMSEAAANKQPVSIADRARLGAQQELVQDLEQRALAQENASVPEEMLAALAKKEERIGRREELLQEARARSPFEALIAGGAALTQGRRGESFGEALTRGLQAGLQQYGSARRANEEGVEALGEARDEAALRRLELSEKARADAVNLIDRQSEIMQRAMTMRDSLIKSGVAEETADATVQTAIANAKRAGIEADYAPRRQEAEIAYYNNRGDGRSGSKTDVEGRQDRNELDDAAAEYEGARAAYNAALRENGMKASLVPADVRNEFLKAEAALKSRSRAYARKRGSSPYIGAESPTAQTQGAATNGGAGWSAIKF
jgi:hypothetical protein